ncbi:MAG: hypothetical protein WCJ31_15190 [Planctomycetia bacterium]
MAERRTDDATLIEAVRILSRTIQTDDGVIAACLAEVATRMAELIEERRWVPVGERLPEDEEWVDVAGEWGDFIGWHDGEQWTNCDEDQLPGVTHWRKRTPGPEGDS